MENLSRIPSTNTTPDMTIDICQTNLFPSHNLEIKKYNAHKMSLSTSPMYQPSVTHKASPRNSETAYEIKISVAYIITNKSTIDKLFQSIKYILRFFKHW